MTYQLKTFTLLTLLVVANFASVSGFRCYQGNHGLYVQSECRKHPHACYAEGGHHGERGCMDLGPCLDELADNPRLFCCNSDLCNAPGATRASATTLPAIRLLLAIASALVVFIVL